MTAIEDLPKGSVASLLSDSVGHAIWSLSPYSFPQVVTAYIDVSEEGRNRLTALHEVAHLLCDTADKTAGHGLEWAATQERLITAYLSPNLGALWRVEFDWWSKKAEEKIAADPAWLAG